MNKHLHRWTIEPATMTRKLTSGDIDGELYTARATRGNLAGDCKCGDVRQFAPLKRRRIA
jgi:hypothetical protein